MDKEDKELLIKDLCARFPYKIICKLRAGSTEITEQLGFGGLGQFMYGSLEVKPYLRPMSSMTEEEEKEFDKVFDIELKALEAPEGHTLESAASSAFVIDFYNKYHIDYRGLIDKDLALKAPKDMYKEE